MQLVTAKKEKKILWQQRSYISVAVISSVEETKSIWLIALKTVFPLYNNANLIISQLKYLLQGSLHVVQMLTQQIMYFEQNGDI